EVDDRNEKMGYKIRASQTKKIPYQLVVGDKEMDDATVNVRRYGSKETSVEDLNIFVDAMVAEVKNYSREG
ncbi:MAG: His/Gly/Thr/Pro-type tRNA ligase C-terminal domain-containing protein, partial [Enterococcus thailandicus]|nr:His/Gly/Thr/Pro-type tRNA ligase C-terminal domain-containing protein [Enterococcus thailandicus]